MRTERYTINLKSGLIGNISDESELIKSLIIDFFALDKKEAEKQFGEKDSSLYHSEFVYGRWYSQLTTDDIIILRNDENKVELRFFIGDCHVSTPSGTAYALSCMFRKMIDKTVSVEYINPEIELLMLGPVKQPEYCQDADWYDEDNEQVRWYHIGHCCNGCSNHSVEETLYFDSYRTEVYGIHLFYDENEICDYLEENYPDAKEL